MILLGRKWWETIGSGALEAGETEYRIKSRKLRTGGNRRKEEGARALISPFRGGASL